MKAKWNGLALGLAIVGSSFLLPGNLQRLTKAADIVWTQPVDGDFGDAANWTALQVHGVNDTATFSTVGTYLVTFDSTPHALPNPVVNAGLAVTRGAVTFASGASGVYSYELGGRATLGSASGGTTLNLGTNTGPLHLTVGDELVLRNDAALNVLFGSQLTTGKLSIGTLPNNGGGTLTVDGSTASGTELNVTGTTAVGGFGTSALVVNNSAQATLNRVEVGVFSATQNSTSNFTVASSADVTVGDVLIGTGAPGSTYGATMTVSGGGSSVTHLGASSLTIGNFTSTPGAVSLTVDTGATYTLGTGATTLRGRGLLSISGGTFITAGDFNVNADGAPNAQGPNLSVSGTFTQTGASSMTVGAASGGVGNVSVNSAGVLSTGTGILTINKTGAVVVTGGSLLANGDVLVNGGLLQRTTSTSNAFQLAPGRTMTVQAGGRASFTSNYSTAVDGIYNVLGGGSRLEATGMLTINNGASVNVSSGGTLSTTSSLNIAAVAENNSGHGTLVVDGAGSFVSGSSGTWGTSGVAQVTIRNNAQMIYTSTVSIGQSGSTNSPPSGALVVVESGGKLLTGSFSLGNVTSGANMSVNLTVTGAGSAVTLNQGGSLTVGGFVGSATVNVNDGATLTAGSSTQINTTGTININGGVVDLKSTNKSTGGKINFNSGTLSMANTSVTIGTNGLLGENLTLNPAKTLNLGNGSLTVNAGSFVTLQDGASFAPFNVNNSGQWNFEGVTNTLTTTQGFTNTGVLRGNVRFASGLSNSTAGQLSVGAGQRFQITKPSTNAGRFDVIGATDAPAELRVDMPFINSASTGQIAGRNSILRFANVSTAAGLSNAGSLVLTGGTNEVFGSISNSGSIVVTGGATATFYDDVFNSGTLQVSKVGNTNSVAVFLGSFGGAGGTTGGGDIFFEGDLRPGNSPASVAYNNNVSFGASANLQIELGGKTLGAQYDHVDVNGQLSLGGTLKVSLINAFAPTVGNTFDILNWQETSGTFAGLDLPTLDSPLAWSTTQLYSAGSLSVVSLRPGDFNQDGALTEADIQPMLRALVNRDTYLAETHLSDSQLTTVGDLNNSGTFTNRDIQSLLNAIASGGGAVAAVPEPCGLLLCLVGIAVLVGAKNRH
jgi:hypothetical protein